MASVAMSFNIQIKRLCVDSHSNISSSSPKFKCYENKLRLTYTHDSIYNLLVVAKLLENYFIILVFQCLYPLVPNCTATSMKCIICFRILFVIKKFAFYLDIFNVKCIPHSLFRI